jgi:ribonuclease HI
LVRRRVRQRLKKRGWRSQTEEMMAEFEGVVGERGKFPEVRPPWEKRVELRIEWEGVKGKDEEVNRQEALRRLGEEEYDVVIYTDGSASEGRSDGGAGCVVTRGGYREPEVVETIEVPAGRVCSSFQAEMVALREALRWLKENEVVWRRARLISDSQSSLRALSERAVKGSNSELVARVEEELVRLRGEDRLVVITWVPSHCGVVGNELADRAAGRAARLEQDGVGCSFDGMKRRVGKWEDRREWENERIGKIYGGKRSERCWELESEWSREEAVSMARFRCGHTLELASYRARIGLQEAGRCRRCEEEEETVEHVMECEAGLARRRELGLEGLNDVWGKPVQALSYWRWWRRKRLKSQ